MANLSPYAAAQMLNWLTGGSRRCLLSSDIRAPMGGPAQRPSFFQPTLLHFRYRNPEKRNPAVTGILLQGPDTSTGRVRLGCGTEKLIMTLTSREWEVATLVAKGLSNKQIARHLNVGEGTVKIHLHNIYGKLAVKNRTVLALMTQRVIESGCSEDRKGGAALAEAVAAA
jgi:DNA-binding CsgD family transcriptional regulator